jgi:hypothetical protein
MSMGSSEARFWAHNLFDVVTDDPDAAPDDALPCEVAVPAAPPLRVAPGAANPRLAAYGLPPELCVAAVNPGFVDPFCPDADVTLNNPTYWGLMQGKLDWLLLRGAGLRDALAAKSVGNCDFALSDHKWIAVDVRLPPVGA